MNVPMNVPNVSFRWSLGPHSAWGSIESMTILPPHPSLLVALEAQGLIIYFYFERSGSSSRKTVYIYLVWQHGWTNFHIEHFTIRRCFQGEHSCRNHILDSNCNWRKLTHPRQPSFIVSRSLVKFGCDGTGRKLIRSHCRSNLPEVDVS